MDTSHVTVKLPISSDSIHLVAVSVCVVESGLQISPATLLLPSPVRAQSRQETTSAIFTCVQVYMCVCVGSVSQ